MSIKRSIILRGCPEVNEYGSATEAIKPGYLVKGVSSVSKQSATGKVVRALALERDEFGVGIDDSLQGSGTVSASYAADDQVKVGVFDSGDEATAYVGSGENIAEDDLLGSAGGGLFGEVSAANAIARSLEALGVVTVETAVRIQFI